MILLDELILKNAQTTFNGSRLTSKGLITSSYVQGATNVHAANIELTSSGSFTNLYNDTGTTQIQSLVNGSQINLFQFTGTTTITQLNNTNLTTPPDGTTLLTIDNLKIKNALTVPNLVLNKSRVNAPIYFNTGLHVDTYNCSTCETDSASATKLNCKSTLQCTVLDTNNSDGVIICGTSLLMINNVCIVFSPLNNGTNYQAFARWYTTGSKIYYFNLDGLGEMTQVVAPPIKPGCYVLVKE